MPIFADMENKKRVLLISKWYPSPQYTSAGIFVQRHALATLPHAHIHVLHAEAAASTRGIHRQYQEEDGLDTLRYTFPKTWTHIPPIDKVLKFILYYYCMIRGFYFLNKKYKGFDLIHATVLLRVGIFALLIRQLYGIPYIITEHWTGYLSLTNHYQKSKLRRWLCPPIIRRAALILPASHDLGQAMQSHGLHNEYVTVHNVVDTQLFNPPSILPTGRIRILSVAMLLDQHKNISGILRTLALLHKEGVAFEYHILGKGKDREKLEAYAQELGLEEVVYFHGLQAAQEVARQMQMADFLLMFSNYENLPCVIVEAFASGLPVIATDVGGISEMITNEQLGQLVNARDEEALLETTRKMIRLARQSDKAYIARYAENHFSYRVIGQQLAQLYHRAINQYS